MRRRLLTFSAVVSAGVLVGSVVAWAAATTEIDRADASFQLSGTPRVVHCVGEDSATKYTQYVATYTGAEGDTSPAVPTDLTTGGLDHGLSGQLTWNTARITFNDLTGRGVANGTLLLQVPGPAGVIKVFSGALVLIVQRDAAGGPVLGRGWLSASTFDPTTLKPDGKVLANVEVTLTPTLTAITGIFGENNWPIAGGAIPPFAVETGLKFAC